MNAEEIKKYLDSLYYQDDVCSISYDKLKNHITNLQQEIERLNNNWNELEEWLEKQEDINKRTNSIIFEARGFEDRETLNKLKELKEKE